MNVLTRVAVASELVSKTAPPENVIAPLIIAPCAWGQVNVDATHPAAKTASINLTGFIRIFPWWMFATLGLTNLSHLHLS
jgi:hypothetical protein